MEQTLYDVFFTGQLVEGADVEAAKASFGKMFKASPEAVAKFFSGGAQVLKRGVDKSEALKYKAALHKAGMMVAFKAHQDAANAAPAPAPAPAQAQTTRTAATTASAATAPAQGDTDDWSLAPTGAALLRDNERQVTPPREVDTSAIKLASAFASFEPEPKPTPPPPNTSHISVAAVGEDLLLEKAEPPPPLPLDLDAMSLAPPGADLEELRDQRPPLNPDISGISMAEPGADLREGQPEKHPPPPPNTDHIKVIEP